MVGYQNFLKDKEFLERFEKNSKIAGVIFFILGIFGIFFPAIMSLTTAYFVSFLFIFSSILIGVHTYNTNKKDWLGWLKSLLFLTVAILIIINPISGVVALGVLFSAYFFIDSGLNLALAFGIKPKSGWWIVLLNSILSLLLGAYFLYAIADPIKTMWLVGIFVGISLFFDGVMLLSLSNASKRS